MIGRKTLLLCLALSLLCIAFCSCETRPEPSLLPPLPMGITVNGVTYYELDLETIQNLDLVVESCHGLTEIGKIERCNGFMYAEGAFHRREIQKSKDDWDTTVTYVSIGDTAYAHPNPRYPNLVVALVDGAPAIFQFSGGKASGKSVIDVIRGQYGLTSAEMIREIRVSSQQFRQAVVPETTVTDRTELQRFFDAFTELRPSLETDYVGGEGEGEDSFPVYFFEVVLDTGFSFQLDYLPNYNKIGLAGYYTASGETLDAWLRSYVKP